MSCFHILELLVLKFKVSFLTEGTREEDRVALLGESLERSRRLEGKMLLFNNGKKPWKEFSFIP